MNITKTTMTLVALAAGMAMHTVASEQGLVAHFTFDDAAHWGFDSVRQAEIGTVYDNVVPGFSEPVASASSCAGSGATAKNRTAKNRIRRPERRKSAVVERRYCIRRNGRVEMV